MHKIAFFGPSYRGIRGKALYLKVLTQGNFVAEIHQEDSVLLVKQRISVSELSLGAQG